MSSRRSKSSHGAGDSSEDEVYDSAVDSANELDEDEDGMW